MRVYTEHAETPKVESTPHWEHDCKSCKFLGSIMLNQRYDIYVCPHGSSGGTCLARYGPENSDYASWDLCSLGNNILTHFRHNFNGQISQDLSPWMQAMLYVMVWKHGEQA